MSTDLVVQSTAYSRATLAERGDYVNRLTRAGNLLPESLTTFAPVGPNGQMVKVGDPGKVLLMAETGDMLGIHPVAALTGVHIIEGKPSISANLMGGLVRRAGHILRVKTTGSLNDKSLTATAQLIRKDDPDYTFEVTWNVEKAERAGLLPGKANSNWQKYPDAMMKARAISEIIREGAPDVLMGGNVYTPEELGAVVDEQGEPVELVQADAPSHGGTADVSRETPMSQPRPETPIPAEEPKPKAEGGTDWAKEIRGISSSQEARDLYQRAKREGSLDQPVKVGRKAARPLSEILTEIGKSMVAAEEAAVEEPAVEATVDETDPSVGGPASDEASDAAQDDNIVDADVVTDEPTYD